MTQNERILRALRKGQVLTPLTAFRKFGTLRLAARCHELRGQGHDIRSTLLERHGKRFACYRLAQ